MMMTKHVLCCSRFLNRVCSDGERPKRSTSSSRLSSSFFKSEFLENSTATEVSSYLPQFSIQATMYLGIIDFLQYYNAGKKAEHT